jgi:accessory gene regulator B
VNECGENKMSYSRLSLKISEYLAVEMDYDEETRSCLAYALDSLLFTGGGFITIIIMGTLLGVFRQTLVAAIAGGVLRLFSGGTHCSTPLKCMFTGAALYTFVGWSATKAYNLVLDKFSLSLLMVALAMLSLLIVVKYAPVDCPAKPISSADYRNKLRNTSVIVTLILIAITMIKYQTIWEIAISGGLFVQAISLLPRAKSEKQ